MVNCSIPALFQTRRGRAAGSGQARAQTAHTPEERGGRRDLEQGAQGLGVERPVGEHAAQQKAQGSPALDLGQGVGGVQAQRAQMAPDHTGIVPAQVRVAAVDAARHDQGIERRARIGRNLGGR